MISKSRQIALLKKECEAAYKIIEFYNKRYKVLMSHVLDVELKDQKLENIISEYTNAREQRLKEK